METFRFFYSNAFTLICAVMLFHACANKNEKKTLVPSFPYYPDTDAIPALSLLWDRPLDSNSVSWIGTYGVWEGTGAHVEIAAELELHLNLSGEAIYALSDGVVVYVQTVANQGDAIKPNEVEGIWVRYGRNFMLKYVHVGNPLVREGDIIRQGQRIGSTANYNNFGFWEVEAQIRQGNRQYIDCLYNYFDPATKNIFDALITDPQIQQASGIDPQANITWCAGGLIDATNTNKPGIW